MIALREAAHENLYAAANSNAMDNETGTPGWVKAFIAADVVFAVLMIAGEVLIVRNYRKKMKKA